MDDKVTGKLRIGMTRDKVITELGEPDKMGGTSRKHRLPSVFKYGEIEVHFGQGPSGRLFLVYSEDDEGNGIVLLK